MAKRKKSTPPQRLSDNFIKDMHDVRTERLVKGLASSKASEVSMRELTDLTTRTQNWKFVLEELKTKPKRRKQ